MTGKTKYWLADPQGAKALVEGADQRDYWMRVRGWTETSEAAGDEFVWMQHGEHGGRAKFPAGVADQWESLGWQLAAPQAEPDLTKDPALVDQPAAVAVEPEKPKTTSADGGDKSKESSRG